MNSLKKIFTREYKSEFWFTVSFTAVATLGIIFVIYQLPLDPDLGWHLKEGELILKLHQLPQASWYTYSLPNFPYVAHEAFLSIVIYIGQKLIGVGPLTIIFALITVFTFVFVAGKSSLNEVSLRHRFFSAFLISPILAAFFGIRPIVVGWLLMSTLVLLVNQVRITNNTKKVYFIPLLILVWANLHASFIIGIIYLGSILVTEGLKASYFKSGKPDSIFLKKAVSLDFITWKKILWIFLISLGLTFVNPYGVSLYREMWQTISDPFVNQSIGEFLATSFQSTMGYMIFIYLWALLEFIYLQTQKKLDFTDFILFIMFLFLALHSVYYIPLFIIVTFPFFLSSTKFIYDNIIDPVFRHIIGFWGFSCLILASIASSSNLLYAIPLSFSLEQSQSQYYPAGAVEYLKRNPGLGNLYNEYNWGGYLIQNLSQYKTFINGIMPHWRIENRTSENKKNDPLSKLFGGNFETILEDATKIGTLTRDWDKKLEEYKIGVFLIYGDSILDYELSRSTQWKELYRDNGAVIYAKNKK